MKEGQEVYVKLLGFDDRGKVRLSMKIVDQATGAEIPRAEGEPEEVFSAERPPRRGNDFGGADYGGGGGYDSGYGSPSRVYEAIRLPGMTPATYGRGGQGASIGWTSYSHTGVPVPVFAQGSQAKRFAGFYDNTDIAKQLAKAMGIYEELPVAK